VTAHDVQASLYDKDGQDVSTKPQARFEVAPDESVANHGVTVPLDVQPDDLRTLNEQNGWGHSDLPSNAGARKVHTPVHTSEIRVIGIAAVTTSASTRPGADRTLVDPSVSVKVRLAGLWAAMMLLYVYADILSLFRPGQIAEIESGEIGPFDVSQSSLVIASLIVILPALMIALSLTLRASINRPANLAFGLLFTLVNVSNLLGESWVYYFLFGLLEIALTLTIVATAWNWPRRDSSAAAA
jgi:Family of unknown function (DUF6326)